MKNKKTLILFILIFTLGIIGYLIFFTKTSIAPENNGEKLIVPEGETYYVPDEAKDMIIVNLPKAGGVITSPLTISGEARGYWFFEATAPVVLVDWDGLIIAEGYIQAEGDWMTEEFVPFTGTLEFEKPTYGDTGSLIIRRDNPSDLRRNDAAVEMPIRFN
ncbi:Gmad2 immunoglobulin-like domain-containing protein [Patescibacteria group bacterium]|nr:Gmad2 immunoglobulin-like domain-containing protein [Patescibacteria group bacterium]